MPQVKKEEIRNRIIDNATELFAYRGYNRTSISDIAKKSGISTGNVYRYFKNKTDLLHEVLPEEFIQTFKERVKMKITTGKTDRIAKQRQDLSYILNSEEFQKYIVRNRLRILILNHPEGTPYVSFNEDIVSYAVAIIKDNFITGDDNEREKEIILEMLFRGYLNLTYNVLANDWDEEQMIYALNKINGYHVSGIAVLLDDKNV